MSEINADSRKISGYNLAIVLALCLGSLTYGYTFSIVSTTLGQPGFYDYFDLSQVPTNSRYSYTNAIIGAMNGCFCGGGFFGAGFVAWSSDALGRKKTLWIASPLAILGGALQGGAAHIAMFLVGRIIGGFAVGVLVVLIPVFQAEIAPPAARGFLVGQHGFILVVGYSLAAWIGFASYYSSNLSFQWRFPLCVQVLFPLGMLILTPFCPESPRWLLMKERRDESWAITQKLHGSPTEADSHASRFAREEFYQMTHQVAADRIIATNETVWTLFKKPSYRRRMMVAALTMFGCESTAILVVYNYSVLLYEGLGFKGSIPLLLAAAYVTVACCSNFINSLLVDRVGRVRLLLIGWSGCLLSLIFETAMDASFTGKTPANHSGLDAGVFFLFLYIAFYGCCVDASSFIYCSEIFPSHIRGRGMSWALAVLFLSALSYLEGAPTAFARIGWKYYLVFIILTSINIPLFWYLAPETKGLSLEEIGGQFGDEVVVRLTHITEEERKKLDEEIDFEEHKGISGNYVETKGVSP